GTYTVRLIIGENQQEVKLNLLMDPRIDNVSQEDLRKQEELSLKLVDLISEASQKTAEVEDQIKVLGDKDSEEKKSLEALLDQLKQAKGSYTQPKLVEQMQYLYSIITQADQVPGKDAYERYEE
ncbi:MAG: hypothetical protein KDD63_11440, partial [Bacteroidetes bacterium]|nr:hypothetical protein [Bacteroidota bacterium]